ncbi:MAG: hypothetical protein PHG69_02365, partial [Candidatus Omnitrophica bacterium]|nr:hypothetical protein [Candidatus Omnitrophota bacterium]
HTSTGDPSVIWQLAGTPKYHMGVDNSIANDPIIIGAGGAVGTTPIITMYSNLVRINPILMLDGNLSTSGTAAFGSAVSIGDGWDTFGDGDPAPSVAGGAIFKTSNRNPTTITSFSGVSDGQIFIVVAGDDNTTIEENANIILAGSTNVSLKIDETITFVGEKNKNISREISRTSRTAK